MGKIKKEAQIGLVKGYVVKSTMNIMVKKDGINK